MEDVVTQPAINEYLGAGGVQHGRYPVLPMAGESACFRTCSKNGQATESNALAKSILSSTEEKR